MRLPCRHAFVITGFRRGTRFGGGCVAAALAAPSGRRDKRQRAAECSGGRGYSPDVPTLFRFLFVIAVIAGLVFGGMLALVAFVKPEPREIIEIVPPAKLLPK